MTDDYELIERAAIIEYCANLPIAEAERRAREEVSKAVTEPTSSPTHHNV